MRAIRSGGRGSGPGRIGGAVRGTTGALAALLLLAGALGAQEPRVRVQADTSVVTVGDRLNYRITVEHPDGARVVWPDSLDLAPFEVLSARVLPTRQGQEVSTTTAELVLTVFDLGEVEIPPLALAVELPDGSTVELESDGWGVEVRSVGLDESEEIRAIKGPLSMALSVVSILPWVVLALALIGVAIWWWRRLQPEESRELGPVILPRPPHEVAHEALDELERAGYLERGSFKEYHVRLSEIVRIYLEGRYEVRALEMTTAEVVDGLWRVGVEGELLDRLRRLLERTDLVKFAKFEPDASESRALLEEARVLVEETRSRVMEFGDDAGEEEE